MAQVEFKIPTALKPLSSAVRLKRLWDWAENQMVATVEDIGIMGDNVYILLMLDLTALEVARVLTDFAGSFPE